MAWRRVPLVLVCLVMPLFGGCQLAWYGQALQGQLQLMTEARPVGEVERDVRTPPRVRAQLALADQVLTFAEQHMKLPVDDAYRSYADLHRDAVVWNVLAAPPYSLQPRRWCYPLVGCVSYRGYFHQRDALAEAQRLSRQGEDTYVNGAIAYSTLGWLPDPLTSPMLALPPVRLVDVLLHELTHRRLYIAGHTRFNESLAVLVARKGTQRYLARHDLPVGRRYWQRRDCSRRAFLALVAGARRELAGIYASDRSPAAMEAAKQGVITRLRRDFHERQQTVPGLRRYAGFFRGPLNNAQLNSVHDYHGLVPAFRAVLRACAGQWGCFWQRVEHLGRDRAARRAWVAQQDGATRARSPGRPSARRPACPAHELE